MKRKRVEEVDDDREGFPRTEAVQPPVQLAQNIHGTIFHPSGTPSQPPADPFPYDYPPPVPPILAEDNALYHPGVQGPSVMEALPPTAEGTSGPAQPKADQALTVCFGMIAGITGRCDLCLDKGQCFDISVLAFDKFEAVSGSAVRGKIKSEHGRVIQGLLDDPSVVARGTCALDQYPSKGKAKQGPGQVPCTLNITVYGPLEMFDEIGEWAQGHDIYLQDPLVCHLDVVYCNPHKLSSSSSDLRACPMLSKLVSSSSKPLQLQELPQLPDILDFINSHINLEEAPAPSAVRTSLQKHQRQALTFMCRREKGWDFAGAEGDMWELIDSDHGRMFINRVSGSYQTQEPADFRGGILADPMGLGKTLTMIALVASDLDIASTWVGIEDKENMDSATLVVVPPPLLDTWENEISGHIFAGRLVCRRHHAKTRLSEPSNIRGVNVVLTTYHTVSAEWRPTGPLQSSILFSTRWRRIILDEAHFIRNGSSRMTRAVCDLDAVSRWAVTGTPIQNRLIDLASLLRFIRAFPYTDPKRFDVDISQLWRDRREDEAVKRLTLLSSCLLLRRPPNTISLPARRDTLCPVEFLGPERELYKQASERLITKIDEAFHQGSELSRSTFYVNVLQQIESLRLICNLGTQYHTRKDPEDTDAASTMTSKAKWAGLAQRAFNVERDLRLMVCLQCADTFDTTEVAFEDPFSPHRTTALLFSCLKYLCSDCTNKLKPTDRGPGCGHSPSCHSAEISISSTDREDLPETTPSDLHDFQPSELPSKVKALIDDLKQLPLDTKSVVFSSWRMTLDVIERGLRQAKIGVVRFDGKVQQRDRKSVVEKFKANGNVRVMLLTLPCGAVGLTLTVASRAYLMEPHWNPTLEDQALARIHRIGQKKEVTTVRFYIRDSFEEEIMKLQQKKKQLAGVLLSPHDGGNTSGSWDRLHISSLGCVDIKWVREKMGAASGLDVAEGAVKEKLDISRDAGGGGWTRWSTLWEHQRSTMGEHGGRATRGWHF
ncbi:hypothetical protein RB597_005463 [Gaeumannomyces tritici]